MIQLRNLIKSEIEALEIQYIRAVNLSDLNKKIDTTQVDGFFGVHANIPNIETQGFGLTKTQFITYAVDVYFLKLNAAIDDTSEQVDTILDESYELCNAFFDRMRKHAAINMLPQDYNVAAVDTYKIGSAVATGYQITFDLVVEKKKYECEKPVIIEGFEFPAGTEYMKFDADFRTLNGYIEATKTGNNFYIITNETKYEVAADGNVNGTVFEYGSSQNNFTVPVYLITTDGWAGFTTLSFVESAASGEIMRVFMRQYSQNFQKLVNLEFIRLASIYRAGIGQEFITNNTKLKEFDSRQNQGFFDYIQFSKAGFKDTLTAIFGDFEESFYFFDYDLLQLTTVRLYDSSIRYDKGFAHSKVTFAIFRVASFYSIDDLDKIIIDLDAADNDDGYLDYRNTATPNSTAYTAYISLISKGWTILGNPPPAP